MSRLGLIGPWRINVCPECNGVAPAFMVGYECISGHSAPVKMEMVEVEPVSLHGGAAEDADRFRLALVRVCEASNFEGAYDAAVDALRQPEQMGSS